MSKFLLSFLCQFQTSQFSDLRRSFLTEANFSDVVERFERDVLVSTLSSNFFFLNIGPSLTTLT